MENKKTKYIIANDDKAFIAKVIEYNGELWVYKKGNLEKMGNIYNRRVLKSAGLGSEVMCMTKINKQYVLNVDLIS